MNSVEITTTTGAASHRIEFFRLPAPGKRDPYFGLSRGWYYKAAALGEIKMINIRQRNALRGVRLVVYDSVLMPAPGFGYAARGITVLGYIGRSNVTEASAT